MENNIRYVNNDGETPAYYRMELDVIVSEDENCCYIDEGEYNMETSDKVIRVACNLPEDFFYPLQIDVEVPKELMAGIKGQVQEVQIPISVGKETKDIKIKESVSKGNGSLRSGIIGMLKRAITVLDKEDKDKETFDDKNY